jgi:hypothetical protein
MKMMFGRGAEEATAPPAMITSRAPNLDRTGVLASHIFITQQLTILSYDSIVLKIDRQVGGRDIGAPAERARAGDG